MLLVWFLFLFSCVWLILLLVRFLSFRFFPKLRTLEQFEVDVNRKGSINLSLAQKTNGFFMEYGPWVFAVFLIRSFLFEPYTIPSGSMIPTLKIGDFVLANKLAYGMHSPISPHFLVRWGEVKRGEIIIFQYPEDTSLSYIKRVIAVPGDELSIEGQEIYVNGKLLPLSISEQEDISSPEFKQFTQTLDDKSFQVQYRDKIARLSKLKLKVPEGQYFVLGDNRDNSRDSRSWGFVPEQNITSKAIAVWMHWDDFFSLPSFQNSRWLEE